MALDHAFESTLAAAQACEDWALTVLYRELQPRLIRYLMAQEPDEGEDLSSDVWLAVGRGITRFKGDESDFRCWIFTIARRRLIDLRRQRLRRDTRPVPIERLVDNADPTDPFVSVENAGVVAALAALSPEQAEIVLLRVVGGLDSNQTALVTGKKPGTVRVIQKRALERLAELLSSEEDRVVTP